jgi:hypothetical protein
MNSLVLLFANRPYLVDYAIENIEKLRLPRKDWKFVIIDTSGNPSVYVPLQRYMDAVSSEWGAVEYVLRPQAGQVHSSSRAGTEEWVKKRWLVAETKNLIKEYTNGDVFLIEEDVLCPPEAFEKLSYIISQRDDIWCASAVNYSRHGKRNQHIAMAWKWSTQGLIPGEANYSAVQIHEKDFGIELVGACANGCIYVRKEAIQGYDYIGEAPVIGLVGKVGSDIAHGYHVTVKKQKLYAIDWSVKTKHLSLERGKVKFYG